MSEAKKLDPQPPSMPMPRLVDELPPINIPSIPNIHGPAVSNSDQRLSSKVAARVESASSSWLTRLLLVLGCIFICFGIGVGAAAMVLSGSIDLKALAWVKQLIHQIAG